MQTGELSISCYKEIRRKHNMDVAEAAITYERSQGIKGIENEDIDSWQVLDLTPLHYKIPPIAGVASGTLCRRLAI
jgi:hypothetical protein